MKQPILLQEQFYHSFILTKYKSFVDMFQMQLMPWKIKQ